MKQIIFSNHSLEQLTDRGTTKEEVRFAIQNGEEVPAKKDRITFRKILFSIQSGKENITK